MREGSRWLGLTFWVRIERNLGHGLRPVGGGVEVDFAGVSSGDVEGLAVGGVGEAGMNFDGGIIAVGDR